MSSAKVIRFKRFSLTFEWWMVLALLLCIMFGYDAIATTCHNIGAGATWWHTAFTAVESLVFVTAAFCCVLKALQPGHPGRFRFYHTVGLAACVVLTMRLIFFEYGRLFLDEPHWLEWITGPLSIAGWCVLGYAVWNGRHDTGNEKGAKEES